MLQPLQMLQIYPLLSMEWIWTCSLAHHHHLALCSLDFRSTKQALFEVLSTKSSTKRRKNEGRSKHWIQILRALSYQPYTSATTSIRMNMHFMLSTMRRKRKKIKECLWEKKKKKRKKRKSCLNFALPLIYPNRKRGNFRRRKISYFSV